MQVEGIIKNGQLVIQTRGVAGSLDVIGFEEGDVVRVQLEKTSELVRHDLARMRSELLAEIEQLQSDLRWCESQRSNLDADGRS